MTSLENLTDAELTEVFAMTVAGWTYHELTGFVFVPCAPGRGPVVWFNGKDSPCSKLPPYATSADLILPWLEKSSSEASHIHREKSGWIWEMKIWNENGSYFPIESQAPTFARAACLALIRAKRADDALIPTT